MQRAFWRALIFIFSLLFSFTELLSQGRRSELELMQRDPDGVRLTEADSLLIKRDPVRYFFLEKNNVQFFTFNNKDTTHIDSLLPLYKKYIDSVLSRNKNKQLTDSADLKKEWFKGIYLKINALKEKNEPLTDTIELSKIFHSINALPNSKQKVWLLLQYADFKIVNKTYKNDVNFYLNLTKEIAAKIDDLFEKGQAFTLIGSYASAYEDNVSAIKAYYQAREYISNSDQIDSLRATVEADACKYAAQVYEKYHIEQGQNRSSFLYKEAFKLYSFSGNIKEANRSYFKSLAAEAYVLTYFYPDDTLSYKRRLDILRELERWYQDFKRNNGKTSDNYTNYLGLYIIATILQGEGLYKVAIKYYLQCLNFSLFDNSIPQIHGDLLSISRIYSLQNRKDLAFGYSNLAIYATEKKEDKFYYYDAILNKAYVFFLYKDYDSSLLYANRVQFDPSLEKIFFPIYYDKLLEQVYGIKYQVFEMLRGPHISDSILRYEQFYNSSRWALLNDYTYLLGAESQSFIDWSDRTWGKNIQKQIQSKKDQRKLYILIGVIVVGGAFFIYLFRISEKNKKIRNTREELSMLARKRFHNIRGNYNSLTALILKGDFENAQLYADACADVLSLSLNRWDWNENYSLADEWEILNAFYSAEHIRGKNVQIISDFGDLDLRSIKFMPETLTTLLHNSIRHAFKDMTSGCEFKVSVRAKKNLLHFEVSDNGTPSKQDRYLIREKEGKGLRLLEGRIKNMFEGKKVRKGTPKLSIATHPGTTIKFVFPYEIIKNNDHATAIKDNYS